MLKMPKLDGNIAKDNSFSDESIFAVEALYFTYNRIENNVTHSRKYSLITFTVKIDDI